jgi:hypothetical protein
LLDPADGAAELSRLEARLPLLLSMIAGMVDSTGFFTLGHVFRSFGEPSRILGRSSHQFWRGTA